MMPSISMEGPPGDAITAEQKRVMLIAYLSYALKDVHLLEPQAYQLLQLTIESLRGSDEDAGQRH